MQRSHSLLFSDFTTPWYKKWSKQLKQNKEHLDGHKLRANKFWQNAVMVQALAERDLLKAGKTGIGFGVGKERLPALFAKHGIQVTATDQDYKTKKAKHWQKHELATGVNSLNKLKICAPQIFTKNVRYRSVDMNKIPKDLFGKYDFVWSNCALGHLGSIDAGLKFIVRSAKCLKPGGYAVHTTEVNIISDRNTLDHNKETVIFRPSDIHKLWGRLKARGFQLSPLKLDLGTSSQDQRIAMNPQFGNDYSKLQVGGHLLTQVVLIISRPKNKGLEISKLTSIKERYNYVYNLWQQRKFTKSNSYLRSIKAYEKTALNKKSILPVRKSYQLTLKGSDNATYLEFINKTPTKLFSQNYRLESTAPIMLATSSPQDRSSLFSARSWFNGQTNRPNPDLYMKSKSGKWESADSVGPKQTFAYKLTLSPNGQKKGTYIEKFMVVQEGVTYIDGSEVVVKVKVV